MNVVTKKWICVVCGYVQEGPEPPDECPLCQAKRDKFQEVTGGERLVGIQPFVQFAYHPVDAAYHVAAGGGVAGARG